MNTTKAKPILFLSDSRGIYIPRDFARSIKCTCLSGVSEADLDYLALGPGGCLDDVQEPQEGESVRGEYYWETWDNVLNNAVVTDNGQKYVLYQDGDLWLIPQDWEWSDEEGWFVAPEDAEKE